jgi:hypothetical protein
VLYVAALYWNIMEPYSPITPNLPRIYSASAVAVTHFHEERLLAARKNATRYIA